MARKAKQASPAAVAATTGLFVDRERLFARLDELRGRAVWLQGPTGAGKTVLLRTYASRCAATTLWVPIDAASGSADTFFASLSAAADRAGVSDLPRFAGEHRKAPSQFVRVCAERIAAHAPGALLVIDDAHRMLPEFATLLAALVEACSAELRVFLAGQDWPLGLESPLASARLVVIGHEHLAFDDAEAVELARRVGAGAELARTMRASTSGWAAGMMLALQLGQGASAHVAQRRLEGPLASLVQSGVLSGVDHHVVAALAALAPARNVPGKLARAGEPWSTVMEHLERLSERGLFVERKENGDFRLHDLLCNALHAVGQCPTSEAVDVLTRVAREELALECLLAIDRAGEALESWLAEHGERLLPRADAGTLAARILEGCIDPGASVLLWCARASLATDLALADSLADRAFPLFPGDREDDGRRLCCGVGLLSQSVLLDAKRFRLWQSRHAEIQAGRGQPTIGPLLDSGSRLVEHVVARSAPTPELISVHADLHRALLEPQPPQEAILAASVLVFSLLQMQRRQEIPALLVEMESACWFAAAPPQSKIEWHINKGFTLIGLGRLEAAAASFLEAVELARQQRMPLLLHGALVGHARTQLMMGRPVAADATVEEAEALDIDPGVPRRVSALLVRIGIELARDRALAALSCIETAERLFSDSGMPTTGPVERARAQVLYALGKADAALSDAEGSIARNSGAARELAQCDRDLLFSLRAWGEDRQEAEAALVRAVTLLEQRRWTNFLLLLPREAGQVAGRALRLGVAASVVRDAIRERRLPAPEHAGPGWPWPLRIFLFGSWRLERFDEEVRFQGKTQRKPLELLKLLACARDLQMDHASVCSALWPDAEEHAARRSLEMATARLREILGNPDWVRVSDGRTRLARSYVWCDVQALLALCSDAETFERSTQSTASIGELADSILSVYQTSLLAGEEDSPWVLGARERVRTAFVRGVRALTGALDRTGEHQIEARLLERALACEPLAEELASRLMRLYVDRGQAAEALRVYRHLRQMLSVLIGARPSSVTEELGRLILRQHQEGSIP